MNQEHKSNKLPRIAVVEDHTFYRKGLCLAIKRFKFVELAFDVPNGLEFLEAQKCNPADIALMDIMMPVMDGFNTITEARKLFPDLKIVILTMLENDEYVQKFVRAGIQGYLLKNIDHDGLEKALKSVISGHIYFSEELMGFFSRKILEDQNTSKRLAELTTREKEILQLIFDGYSNQEIANKLFISIRTVTNHRYNLKIKTSSKNTAGLISYGLKNKILKE